MPTLIVWGDKDQLIPVQQAEPWRKFLPSADIKIFKGAGHLVLDEKPEAAGGGTVPRLGKPGARRRRPSSDLQRGRDRRRLLGRPGYRL